MAPWRVLLSWPARRWVVALAAAAGFVLVVAVPTDLIDTPDQRRIDADLSLIVARGLFDLHGARLKLDSSDNVQAVDILLPRYPLPEPGPIAALLARQ